MREQRRLHDVVTKVVYMLITYCSDINWYALFIITESKQKLNVQSYLCLRLWDKQPEIENTKRRYVTNFTPEIQAKIRYYAVNMAMEL